ncbi:50S ribosomal protein L10 [Desulforamulus hydrothermalis]|uniref:Large ribosomal subunit protein uL10 n=1 Tax=Desulforamulus hydrothermalis Lam5 = DSM 18033 TaxID=1121428 RepID=K8DYA0_9FIRM|nr:50S ribosomal protein L10 [Desulforamulus hydrothermalis]CCO07787.1 50S ribosomal protein L10 [Desulforamulus hydrothermalis Lam5 = DSM 18033]SHH42851.1 LSU ribosomal protein L10P [Desulforamulus hydrothermalis Lam5 = DSM 18033]
MPTTKAQKAVMLEEIKEKMSQSQVTILADFRGISVAKITDLRARLRKAGSEMKVAKNTVARIAAREIGVEGLDPYLEGPTVFAFGIEDPVAPAKILSDFAKEVKQGVDIKAGILEGKVIDANGVKALADLPSREVLLAKVLGGMQAPLYGFAGVLAANLRNLVYVLDQVRQQKESQAS